MGSLDLQLWTHIGAMNRHSAVRCPRFSVSLRFGHPKGWTPNRRFMESLDVQLWTRIGTINLHSAVRCPRFSVSLRFGHPKGWTPNGRFMERAADSPSRLPNVRARRNRLNAAISLPPTLPQAYCSSHREKQAWKGVGAPVLGKRLHTDRASLQMNHSPSGWAVGVLLSLGGLAGEAQAELPIQER